MTTATLDASSTNQLTPQAAKAMATLQALQEDIEKITMAEAETARRVGELECRIKAARDEEASIVGVMTTCDSLLAEADRRRESAKQSVCLAEQALDTAIEADCKRKRERYSVEEYAHSRRSHNSSPETVAANREIDRAEAIAEGMERLRDFAREVVSGQVLRNMRNRLERKRQIIGDLTAELETVRFQSTLRQQFQTQIDSRRASLAEG